MREISPSPPNEEVPAQHLKWPRRHLDSQLVTLLTPLVSNPRKVPWTSIDETTDLVNKVRKSLKDAGGAASEYQSAVIELENLATTLSHLEALQPNEDNIQHVNAIRAMAMACQFPLEEFRRKMTRYESSLGPLARRKSLYTIGQKTKWSVIFAEDVEKLRALIAAKHVSINLLLGMQTS